MKSSIFDSYNKTQMNRWIARLRQLAKTCEFSDINKEIKEHIILTRTSSSLRRRALRENLSLENLLKLGRALELSEKQAKQVEKTDSDVHRIKNKGSDRRSRPLSTNSLPSRSTKSQSRNCHYTNKFTRAPEKCDNCGGYAHHRNPCPARGK